MDLELEGITYKKLAESIQNEMSMAQLYTAFYHSIKKCSKGLSFDDALEIIDEYYATGKTLEDFIELVLGEWSEAMGFGKQFKRAMKKEKK